MSPGATWNCYIGPPPPQELWRAFSDPAKIEEATERYRTSYAVKGQP